MKPKIKYIDYGLGFTICEGNKKSYIELNKNLNKYPKLKRQVLAHELLHWKSKSLSNDFKIDILEAFNVKQNINKLRFLINNPKALKADLPLFIEEGKVVPNYIMMTLWGLILVGVISLITAGFLIFF